MCDNATDDYDWYSDSNNDNDDDTNESGVGAGDVILGEERSIEKLLKAPLEKWWVCFTLILF